MPGVGYQALGARLYFYYITDRVLSQALPPGFVRHLLRVVRYPGGFPLSIRTASTSSTAAPPNSPAHALLFRTTILVDSIPLLWEICCA